MDYKEIRQDIKSVKKQLSRIESLVNGLHEILQEQEAGKLSITEIDNNIGKLSLIN